MFARPACGLRSPLAATACGQVLSPGFSTRLPGLQITRRHQGFIRIRPSGLPLARLLPRTERRPLGFFPELRTPTNTTRRRTSGRGSVTNTNRELRDRHSRPPIHELTHMRDIASHPQVLIIAHLVAPLTLPRRASSSDAVVVSVVTMSLSYETSARAHLTDRTAGLGTVLAAKSRGINGCRLECLVHR